MKPIQKIPVSFFVFRRPAETALVFAQIRKYRPTHLLVVADGPRPDKPGELEAALEVRDIVSQVDWECEVVYEFSEQNLGLRERILSGLDRAFELYEECVVLEDDCLPHQDFFNFCKTSLNTYSQDPGFGMVSGFNPAPVRGAQARGVRAPMIWGWATTRSTWKIFRSSPQVESWPETDHGRVRDSFTFKPASRSFLRMMETARSLNTWDVSLAVWFRIAGRLAVVPPKNMIQNIGFGDGATHTNFESFTAGIGFSTQEIQVEYPAHLALDLNFERRVWFRSARLWISFPLLHPIEFLRKFLSFARRTSLLSKVINRLSPWGKRA